MKKELIKKDDLLTPEQVKILAEGYNGEDEELVRQGVSHSTLRVLSNNE